MVVKQSYYIPVLIILVSSSMGDILGLNISLTGRWHDQVAEGGECWETAQEPLHGRHYQVVVPLLNQIPV
ncbi:hypothetical protein OG21DRAFT_1202620 [Imleria badia]|nr:hypothetical protein OG21DRAFT_1202620 [Imleria badia]